MKITEVADIGEFRGCSLLMDYGVLMPGQPEEGRVSKLIGVGDCHTADWHIIVDSQQGFPYMIRTQDHPKACCAAGYLYRIPKCRAAMVQLYALDIHKGHPRGFTRRLIKVWLNGARCTAWCYIVDPCLTEFTGISCGDRAGCSQYTELPLVPGAHWEKYHGRKMAEERINLRRIPFTEI